MGLLIGNPDDVGDEDRWTALVAALEEADDDGELWTLGDGLIDESIRTRPALEARWRAARSTNLKVADVCRVMQDPRHNWPNAEGWCE